MTATGYLRFPHIVGDQLVFTAEDDVWLASADGGRAHRLTADSVPVSRPRLSPDGTQVAWVSRRRGEPEVFVMPTAGGVPRQLTFFGVAGTATLGFAPDGRLLVCSTGSQPSRSQSWAYAIDITEGADGTPQLLPYGPVNAVAYAPAGSVVVGTGYLRDPAHWKRYRGGTAGRLWLDPAGSGEFAELLGDVVGPKHGATWVADRLAFIADFEGHGNVYSVAADGGDLRRHTDHQTYYARQLAGDGNRLAYQHAGGLWLLDGLAADSQPRQLDISLGSARAGRASRELSVPDQLGDYSVDRTARASVLEVRGNILWLTHRNGPARILASTPGVRHRLPVILASQSEEPDSVAYLSSADGTDAIEIAAADGSTRRFGSGELGRVLELVAAPDGSLLVAATHDGRVLKVGLDGAISELDASPYGDATGLTVSGDSKWLAYAAHEQTTGLHSIQLVELATGTVTAVTGERFDDASPVFSEDGKYLAFLSARTFDPVYDAHVFDLGFSVAVRPYLVTLAADTPSPFDPELAGRPTASAGDKAGDKPAEDKPAEDKAAEEQSEPAFRVEVETIADRVVPFPVPAGRLERLLAAKDGFVWTNAPVAGELGESRNPDDDIRPSVQRWDFGKRKLIELAEHADTVRISGDGTALVIRDREALKVIPADRKAAEDGEDTVEIDLSRVRLSVQPPAEWAQMLDETGRLMREHYWTEDMAGIDWDAAVDKYRPLVDQLASRDDLSDLLWEVNGETGSSHAYETPPPPKKDPLLQPAYLGADLARTEQGRWAVARVIRGDNSSREARSPLSAPGVGVLAGDEILAVNGRPVGEHGPAELLRGTGGKAVELRVARDGVERSVVVVALNNDLELRYLDWVSRRRELVHQASGGRIGYVHVPDMVSTGWAALHRDLRVEMARDALLVDTRDNSGGHISQLVIEKLTRQLIGWDTTRHRGRSSYPDSAPRGPLASLSNEWSGSDGDIVNAAFQSLGLGPVIGTRTWGGVIGIDGRYHLVDGTSVTQPRFSFWFERFGWSVENYGVDPDRVVEFPPQAWGAGADPQLDAGISYLLGELERRPARPMPDLATRPSRRAPELPPRP
ncbi:MAG: PDZ domain-containing protein [Actinomycetota bacterium]|nr:PDZ domain-containing protein [Actinomycetota bacterium]